MQSGWYPDPTGRYELRYFNGVSWTADVASGGERHVDALGLAPTPVPAFVPPVVEPSNGLATAAMVTGLTGLGLGIVFLFPLSFPLGVLAVVFGGIGLRRSRTVGRGRPQAITGLVTGPIALVLSVVALITLWGDLVEAFDDASLGADATAYSVTFDAPRVDGHTVTCRGVLTNERARARTFTVLVDFLPGGSSTPFATERQVVLADAKASARFTVSATLADGVERPRCAIDSVRSSD